jgi:hypothetical protein
MGRARLLPAANESCAAFASALSLATALVSCSSRPPPPTAAGNFGGASNGGPSTTPDGSAPLGEDSGATGTSSFTVALHPAWPQIVDHGGGVIGAPKIVNASAASCVGPGSGASVALPNAPATSYTDSSHGGASTLQTLIESLVEAGQIPTLGGQTLPVFYFPATTTIVFDGETTCQTIGGFHNSMLSAAAGTTVPYAVVAECPPPSGLTLLEETTFAASHEIFEAATDPVDSATTHGFYLDVEDPAYLPWNAAMNGGEAADMCVDSLKLGQDRTTEDGFTAQRMWSNAAAARGGDPCVPAKTTPFFDVAVETWLQTMTVGSTASFEAIAFSNAPVAGGWTVTGVDLNGTETNPNAYLTITIGGGSSVSVNNGDEFPVSVTLNQDPGALTQTAGGAVGVLISFTGPSLQEATAGAIWPFLARTAADAADSGLVDVDASEDMPLHADVARARLAPHVMTRHELRRLEERIRGAR